MANRSPTCKVAFLSLSIMILSFDLVQAGTFQEHIPSIVANHVRTSAQELKVVCQTESRNYWDHFNQFLRWTTPIRKCTGIDPAATFDHVIIVNI